MTYYGYIRVSTLQQANEGDSLETQLKQITSYASLKGYDIPPENFITERGISGSVEFEKRPEGLKLFERLETGDVLIFSKLDRAFRNTRNALNTLHDLKLRGISVHFIDLGGDVTNDGIGSVIFTILSAFATVERERIATRIREVKQVQKADGKFLGGFTRFGYKVIEDSLDSLFDEYFADKSDEERAAIKKKFGTMRAVLEAPQRIRRVCIDLLRHYREHIQPNGFKAMIVTSSRNAAITYKEQLDALGSPESAAIISGDHNDEKKYWQYTDGTKQKKQIDDFKKPLGVGDGQSNLSILIVKDMLLTGFDVPVAQVMYLDRKLTDHSLLQAIARVNRTNKNKFRGYIVDYYGLSDYLTEALEMFSTEDVTGALRDLKEEIPVLKNTHTRVMQHFKGQDLIDLDACILSLEDETKRQTFQIDFQRFAKQMDIILPDPSATPFLPDLKKLGKISIGARNLYRDEQLNISGAGEKVRQLIEEHIFSTGVDPKIAPVDLLAKDFKQKLNEHKSSRAKASEIENAIKHHIKINLEEDPDYYRPLSERLNEIIRQNADKWDELVQLLMDFREHIESDHKNDAQKLGLSETEYAFHNILMTEISIKSGEAISEETHHQVIAVVKQLVAMMDEATAIIGFFEKWDEQKRVRKEIKRTVLDQPFGTPELVNAISDRFMELAKVKFK